MSIFRAAAANVPALTCAGPAAERGERHGEALRDRIADGLARWKESIAATHGLAPDAYIAEFVQGTDFLPAVRRCTPDLLEEMNGIVRGSNQPWHWIYAYNLLDEEWTWARSRTRQDAPGCTAAGFAPDEGSPVLAQTMDIPSVHDGTQTVLRIEPDDGPSALVFTHAGMIGLTGCNADGVALVVNNLETLPTSRTGLPVAFVLRGLLQRRTLADAVAFARGVPHATGQHYGIASPHGLASIECWATGCASHEPPPRRLLHTNHPLLTDETEGDVEFAYRRTRTRERLAFITQEAAEPRDVHGLQDLLADRSVPVSLDAGRSSMTFGAVVYECSVPPRMWVAPGPPHASRFQHVHW